MGALETLYDPVLGADLPLPGELAALYGRLQFPEHGGRPYVIGNLASTLDGVVALDTSGRSKSREISGYHEQDRAVMGLLRAVADAVVVGAGTFRSAPRHIWTAERIYHPLAGAYRAARQAMRLAEAPINVFVTARGEVDVGAPVFHTDEVRPMIVTTVAGLERLRERGLPASVQGVALPDAEALEAHAVLGAIAPLLASDRRDATILVEGGPRLLGSFCAQGRLDEMFLTLAPQIAGRDGGSQRPGLVAGVLLAPEHPLWGRLVGVKRSESHLFLRYVF